MDLFFLLKWVYFLFFFLIFLVKRDDSMGIIYVKKYMEFNVMGFLEYVVFLDYIVFFIFEY